MKPVQRAIQPPLLGLVDKIVSLQKWDASRPYDLQKRHIRFQIALSFFWVFLGVSHLFTSEKYEAVSWLFLGAAGVGVGLFGLRKIKQTSAAAELGREARGGGTNQ